MGVGDEAGVVTGICSSREPVNSISTAGFSTLRCYHCGTAHACFFYGMYQNAHGDDICAASSGGQTDFAEKNSVKIGGELRALLCS
jgi:hypothetical protein